MLLNFTSRTQKNKMANWIDWADPIQHGLLAEAEVIRKYNRQALQCNGQTVTTTDVQARPRKGQLSTRTSSKGLSPGSPRRSIELRLPRLSRR